MTRSRGLCFVRSRLLVSDYRTPDGRTVVRPHRTYTLGARNRWGSLLEPDDGELAELLTLFDDWDDFAEHLAVLGVLGVERCSACQDPTAEGTTIGYDCYCPECRDGSFTYCDGCNDWAGQDRGGWTGDEWRCSGCLSDYTWCEQCDTYVYGSCSEHDDDDACGCFSPAQSFTIRNDGEDPLSADVLTTVTLPAGTLDDTGVRRVQDYLRSLSLFDVADLVPSLGLSWQTKGGNYPKRLSRAAYNTLGTALSAEVLSTVGTMAREHSSASADYRLSVTRDLNQSAEAFGHSDSCWWGSYSSSRCALKTNGGLGLRTFDADGSVTGRAWVLPLKRCGVSLTPTFSTDADAFIVFNGYGDLSGYTPARLLAHMTGMTYRKVSFTCSPMFVNNDAGYLVAPEELAKTFTDGALHLSTDAHSTLFANESNERLHHVA